VNVENLTLPGKGFTKAERAWLKQLIAAIKTVQAIPGRNCTINNTDAGQSIDATDCGPYP
jgi:hypothetical protein